MQFTLIGPEDERWAACLGRCAHDIYHRPGYVRLLGQERGMTPCACYGVNGSSEFLLPLLLSPIPSGLGLASDLMDAFSPDGYPGPLFAGDQDLLVPALGDLMAFLREQRIVTCFVRSHPALGADPEAFSEFGEVVVRGHTVVIPLERPHKRILREMRQGHRYEIRRALDRGFHVIIDEWRLLPNFVSMYRSLMENVDALPTYRYSDHYFQEFRGSLGKTAHLAFALNAEGVPAAGAIFTMSCGIVEYHLAATDATFKHEALQKLVVDELIRWGIEQRAQIVHLGGGVGARDDSLFNFKSGFSRSIRSYRTIHLVPDPVAEREAREAWSTRYRAAATDEGFFPIHRAPPPAHP